MHYPTRETSIRQGHCPIILVARTMMAPTMDEPDISRIRAERGKRGGRPCIRGLRITVYDVLGWLASGMSEDEILSDHLISNAPTSAPAWRSPPNASTASDHNRRVTLLFSTRTYPSGSSVHCRAAPTRRDIHAF